VSRPIHVLLLADTHLGFDEPIRPRSTSPHRGAGFFANFSRVLDVARAERADAVIHGGDLLYRSRVPDSLVDRAMAPLVELAEAGIPVFVVPGNHERSVLPRTLFTQHDRIHVFDKPRTVMLSIDGCRIAIGGFPSVREGARELFPRLVAATGLLAEPAEVRLLCVHQIIEGARVGPSGYQFRTGEDVVRAADLPGELTAVLCGHVHRHQVLRTDLSGKPLSAPVVYPGSTERTSFAEMSETKGFVSIRVGAADGPARGLRSIDFRELPARPMYVRTLGPGSVAEVLARFRSSLADLDPRGVLRVRIPADLTTDSARIITAVRAMVPPTLIVEFSLPSESGRSSAPSPC
jgi:DNA repair protein SbcD/Mre11